MTIEELKNRNKFDHYVIVDADIFAGLMNLKKFSENAFQGWMACSSEEENVKFHFIELVNRYLNMVEKMSEPLEHTEDDQG